MFIYLGLHCSSIIQNMSIYVLYSWSDMADPKHVETFLSMRHKMLY
jgi:hypothetical protein